MSNNNNDSNDPPLCSNGCGFYGTSAQNNLCSKCYRDSLKKTTPKQEQPSSTPTPTPTPRTNNNIKNSSNNNIKKDDDKSVKVSKVVEECQSVEPVKMTANNNKKKTNRCKSCNKRVGLIGFECKCGGLYCGSHRYPEMHSCKVDYKTVEREALSKTLFKAAECKADKLQYRM